MAATLPRPQRPSLGPPTTPLPSLPVSKSRGPSTSSPATPAESRRGSGISSLLPTPGTAPRSVSSALPQRPSGKKHHGSTSTLPGGTANPTTPGKLRKTISIGAFPQPPKSGGTSPESASSQRHSDVGTRATPPLRKRGEEGSLRQSAMRQSSMRSTSYSNGTSFLNGGEGKSVSLMSLPSPPASRSSSPPDSNTEHEGEESRGRSTSAEDKLFDEKHGKDGKGNVIVSVRVRPDVAPSEREKGDLEWMVDGRRSSISYRGREGGDYSYGGFDRFVTSLQTNILHRQRLLRSR
jgi:centromeric protein E